MRLSKVVGALALVVTCACGAELKLGSSTGLDPIAGETWTFLNDATCELSGGACRLTFERDVVIATRKSYVKLDGLISYIKAVDLNVRVLEFIDGDEYTRVKPEGTVTIANALKLSQSELESLPQTLRLEGAAFEPVRQQIEAGQSATLHVVGDIVVHPPLPSYLVIRYDVQPVMIIGEQ